MCFDFLYLMLLFFLQLKHQSYAGEGSGDSDLDQDYVYIFWWSVCVCVCLFLTKNDHEKSKKTAKFYLNKNNQSKLSAGGSKRDFGKSQKCTRSKCILGAWSRHSVDVNDDDDGDDDDLHGGGGKLLLRGTQSQASLDCRNNKFWSQSITIK